MSTPTTNFSLAKADDADDAENYLHVLLALALDTIDAKLRAVNGGFQVTDGNLGVGGAPAGAVGVTVVPGSLTTGIALGGQGAVSNADLTFRSIHGAAWGHVGFGIGIYQYVLAGVANNINTGQFFVGSNAALRNCPLGLVLINVSGGSSGLFVTSGGGSISLIGDPGNAFGTVNGTANRTNLFYNGGNSRFELDNHSGNTQSYYLLGAGV